MRYYPQCNQSALSANDENVLEGLFGEVGDYGAIGGIAGGDEEEGPFIGGPVEDTSEEAHGTGGMGEGGDAGEVKGGEEETAGQSDAFLYVIVFDFAIVFEAVVDAEDGDEAGGGFEELFVPIGSKGFEGVKPFIGEAVFIVFAFLGFGGFADLAFEGGVGDEDEAPGLLVGAGGGAGGGFDGGLEDVDGDGVGGEVADAAAGADGFEEGLGAEAHFGFGEAGEVEGEEGGRRHDNASVPRKISYRSVR